jgi:hypothetical protein
LAIPLLFALSHLFSQADAVLSRQARPNLAFGICTSLHEAVL